VHLVLAAAVTELLELETAGGRLFVLGRRVVPLLALSALQCDNFPHFKTPQCSVFSGQCSVFRAGFSFEALFSAFSLTTDHWPLITCFKLLHYL
jgi:hypothetical protein